MPAGTGVWVVNTVPARTACSASSKPSPSCSIEFADPLDAEEAGVALVGVEHLGRGRAGRGAVGADGPDAADAEQQFLLEAVFLAAAVEPVGGLAGDGVVVLDVGVEQQQRHPADVDHPDLGVQHPTARQRQRDADRRAARVVGLLAQQA